MPWGRVDDQHYRHEKVAELHDDLRKGCVALFWLSISWCNDRLTDGRVPPGTVRILGGDEAEAEELVRVGLWEKDGRGYRVHDYLDFNKSRVQVQEERIQRRLAGQAGAQARWHPVSDPPSGTANEVPSEPASEMVGEPDGGSDAPVSRTPVPSSVTPAPDARAAGTNDPWRDDEHEARVWLSKHGCDIRPGNGFDRHLVTMVQAHGVNAVVGMFDRLAREGMKDGDLRGFIFGAKDALDARTRPDLRAIEKGEAATERAEVRGRRIQEQMRARRLEHYRFTGEWDAAWGPKPSDSAA